jgi:para-nitrobenzyl esterase
MADFVAAVPNVIPSVDGKVLKHTIRDTFAAGENNKVPVINGSNQSEIALFLAIRELGARLTAKPPNLDPADRSFLMTAAEHDVDATRTAAQSGVVAADLTGRFYPLANFGADAALRPSLASIAMGTDSTFACNGVNVSARIAAQHTPVWGYEFRDKDAPPLVGRIGGKYVLSLPQGAAHGAELQYLFHMSGLLTPAQTALQETMSRYWVNFARTGDPNGPGVPRWPELRTGAVHALDLAGAGGVKAMPKTVFEAEHLCRAAWAKLTF